MYLNFDEVSIDCVIGQLYDFTKRGGVAFPNVIQQEARELLLSAIQTVSFRRPQRIVGEVIQEMDSCYFEENDALVSDALKQITNAIAAEYNSWYAQIAAKANFCPAKTVFAVHRYEKGSIGITPHQDFTSDKNITAIFVLSGNAPFYLCENRKKDNSLLLEISPGSVIFLRAARNDSEQIYRPFHYLQGPMLEERCTFFIRKKTQNESKPIYMS